MDELANYANMTFEQQESYMRSLDTWRTVMVAEEFTFSKGREKGRAEGIEEQANRANATLMKALCVDICIIAQVTGLSTEELDKLWDITV